MSTEQEFMSNIDCKIKSSCPNVQLRDVPAINQKRLVAFVNHFTINMVEYLNKFAQTCQQRLFLCDEKLRRMEDELCLLEAKLYSIAEADGVDVPQEPPPTSSKANEEPVEKEETVNETSVPATAAEETPCDIPNEVTISGESEPSVDITKYCKMVQFGVPIQAVKLKMQQEGFDPQLLDKR